MIMRSSEPSYRGFLLRVWETGDDSETRVSITDVDTRDTRVFADVDGFCRWLRRLAQGAPSRLESLPRDPPPDRM